MAVASGPLPLGPLSPPSAEVRRARGGACKPTASVTVPRVPRDQERLLLHSEHTLMAKSTHTYTHMHTHTTGQRELLTLLPGRQNGAIALQELTTQLHMETAPSWRQHRRPNVNAAGHPRQADGWAAGATGRVQGSADGKECHEDVGQRRRPSKGKEPRSLTSGSGGSRVGRRAGRMCGSGRLCVTGLRGHESHVRPHQTHGAQV